VAQCPLEDMLRARTQFLFERKFECRCSRCHVEACDPVLVKMQTQILALAEEIRRGSSLRNRADVRALIRAVQTNADVRPSFRVAVT
jgi:hypothetical protein